MRSTAKFNFTTAKSLRRIALILNRLARGEAGAMELIALCDGAKSSVRAYLKHLEATHQIICVAEPVFSFDGSTPSIWALSADAVVPELQEGEVLLPYQFESKDIGPALDDVPMVTVTRNWAAPAMPKQSIFAALGI